MKIRLFPSLAWLLIVSAATWHAGSAAADELQELRGLRATTLTLIDLLVQQGVISREKADQLIGQAQAAATAGAEPPAEPVAPGVVRVPYVPEAVKEQIREDIKKDVLVQARTERWGEPGALPAWLDRVTIAGDVRFRGQADRFPTDSVPNALPQQLQLPEFGAYNINNTSEARTRLRVRARLGVEAAVGQVTAGIRLATGGAGSGSDPGSENQTLGNYDTRHAVGFDRAYLSYKPATWLYVTAGRLGNPFLAPTTLVWADDLSLEGIVAGVTPRFGEHWRAFALAGAFPIQDVEPTPLTSVRSKWLYGYQTGFDWHFGSASLLRLGAALYDYRHVEGTPNATLVATDYSLSAAPFRRFGNSVFDINALTNTLNGTQNYLIGLSSKFREADLSLSLDLGFGSKHVMFDADAVSNIGFDHDEILARTGLDLPEMTRGWQGRMTVGDASFSAAHAWQAWLGYRRVESDAVVDAFTDSDFHLGGTNASGYFVGFRYAFQPSSTAALRWFSGKQIDGLPLAIDVLQLDLMTSF